MPNRNQGIAGEVSEAEISLETMNAHLPIGESPHSFSARMEYDYTSTATRDVVFTTFDNWKEKGGAIETGALMSSSFPAPLSVSINAPAEPIIITQYQDNDQSQEFTISVQMRNTGGGYLKAKKLARIELCFDPILVEVSPNDGFKDFEGMCPEKDKEHNCLCILGGNHPNSAIAAENKDNPQLNLIGQTNQWRDVSAIFRTKMRNPQKAVVQVQDISNFGATVKYRYLTDKSAKLTLIRIK